MPLARRQARKRTAPLDVCPVCAAGCKTSKMPNLRPPFPKTVEQGALAVDVNICVDQQRLVLDHVIAGNIVGEPGDSCSLLFLLEVVCLRPERKVPAMRRPLRICLTIAFTPIPGPNSFFHNDIFPDIGRYDSLPPPSSRLPRFRPNFRQGGRQILREHAYIRSFLQPQPQPRQIWIMSLRRIVEANARLASRGLPPASAELYHLERAARPSCTSRAETLLPRNLRSRKRVEIMARAVTSTVQRKKRRPSIGRRRVTVLGARSELWLVEEEEGDKWEREEHAPR